MNSMNKCVEKMHRRLQDSLRLGKFSPKVFKIVDSYINAVNKKIEVLQLQHNTGTNKQSHNHLNNLTDKAVYANNYFNFGEIKVVGFDLDYTLLSYSTELQKLIYTHARDSLIETYGFPRELLSCEFDSTFAVRGLSVDTKSGTLCKLSHLQKVGLNFSFKGKKPLSPSEIENVYGDSRHIPHGDLIQMRPLYDMYSIVEACLIADAMDVFASLKSSTPDLDPAAITDDVQGAVRDVHVSGVMHSAIMRDLDRFVLPSPHLQETLLHLKQTGRKLFLCTNSDYKYSNCTLSYALRGGGSSWRDLFDVIICSAHKPDFYSLKRPFRKWNMYNDTPSAATVGRLEPGAVYVQGSAHALKRATGWLGREVLYLGDNLLTDLKEARRLHGWHTGCILSELEREIEVQRSGAFDGLHFLRSCTRQLVMDLQLQLHSEGRGRLNAMPTAFGAEERELLRSIEQDLQEINLELSALFNKQFGSVFRSHGHLSLFAFAVRQYADIYMSDVTHLLQYNPEHRFYPTNSIHMAHDVTSPPTTDLL
mmetsp:Transcript_7022/g.9963  ORF Transcript_7022/g.9963 Transcript_7022/m.9963 type:complete len:535 (-) Transcript_7022:2086-3690(-)